MPHLHSIETSKEPPSSSTDVNMMSPLLPNDDGNSNSNINNDSATSQPNSSLNKVDMSTEINSDILENEKGGGEEVCDNEQQYDSKVYDYFPNPSIHNPTALETTKWWAEYTSIHGMYYMCNNG